MARHIGLGALLNAEYPVSRLVELGRLIESLGYRQLWYTDVRLFRECYIGLSALAAATTRIQLGPGVTDPYSRHPAVTAATIATFDELCGGRALLGLGVGGTGFRELGISPKLPVAALRETVHMVRRLIAGEQVSVQGKVVSLDGGRLQFAPVRSRVPIYFATHGAQIAKLAGEVADGVLLANTLVPSAIAFYLEQFRDGATKAGRAGEQLDFCLRFEVCIDEDEKAARAVMRRRVTTRLMTGYPHWEFLERLGLVLPEKFAAVAATKDMSRVGEAAALLPDEAIDRTVLAGRAEHVAERMVAAMSPEVTSITIRPHAAAGKSIDQVLETFARRVMPLVESSVA